MNFDAERVFAGDRIPGWLRHFQEEPLNALHNFLLGRADLGYLSAAEPVDVMLGWLRAFGTKEGLAPDLDEILADWIKRSWGELLLPGGAGSATLTAVAWRRATAIITAATGLDRAAQSLRERFLEDRRYLNSLSEGRARDCQAGAWLALAMYQHDRGLLNEWWRLCELPPDEPWYRGVCGIHGLRGLAPVSMARAGGFPEEVADGLNRLGLALWERYQEGWLREETARQEFVDIARLTMVAYPFKDRWGSYWRHELSQDRDRRLFSWIVELVPGLRPDSVHPYGSFAQPDSTWPTRAREIAASLSAGRPDCIEIAKSLLEEQADFAEKTGNNHYIVRSACNFAGRIRHRDPGQGLDWARLAKRFDLWNAFAWTTEGVCLLSLGRAVEAQEVYTEAVRRFADNVVARNGLAEVLKAQGRLDEAEAEYRETNRRFADNVVARTGLAEVLKAQGRLDEATEVYGKAVEPIPASIAPLDEVTGSRRFSRRDATLLANDAFLIRRWARTTNQTLDFVSTGMLRARAQSLLERLLVISDKDPLAAGESGLLELAEGETERALELLRQATQFFPGSVRVRYALARVEREAALQENNAASWRRLTRLDERMEPVQWLGVGRKWLAMNGADEEKARESLGKLGYWLNERIMLEKEPCADTPEDLLHCFAPRRMGFTGWWAREVQIYLFGGTPVKGYDDLEKLESVWKRANLNKIMLDRLEEELVYRFAKT